MPLRNGSRASIRGLALVLAIAAALGCARQVRAQIPGTIGVADGDVNGLISAINELNSIGGGIIELAPSGTYQVTTPNNWWYGPNAFPAISSAITIQGNGATISGASGNPPFRFFYVSGGFSVLPAGALTLEYLILSGGYAEGGSGGAGTGGGGGGAGMGGAIYNQGQLLLLGVLLSNNRAVGGGGGAGLSDTDSLLFYGGGGGGLGGNGGSGNVWPLDGGSGGGGGGMKASGQSNGYGGDFMGGEGATDGGGSSAYGGSGGGSVGCWQTDSSDCQPTSGSGGGGYAQPPAGNGSEPSYNADGPYAGGTPGYGAGSGGAINQGTVPWPLSLAAYSAGGGFGGGGGGDGSDGGFAESDLTPVGAGGGGGFGGGGGGGGGGFGPGTWIYGAGGQSLFGGGMGGAGYGDPGNGGSGMGGAIFNQLGSVYLSIDSQQNTASGGSGGSVAPGLGGSVFSINGTVWLVQTSFTSDSATNSDGSAGQGIDIYVTSNNAGNTAAGLNATANLDYDYVSSSQPSGSIVTNQANGTLNKLTLSSTTLVLPILMPAAVNFGTVYAGGSASQVVSMTNLGTGTMTISNIHLTGASAYSIAGNNCPSTLVQNQSCQVEITLSQTTTGQPAAQLTFSDNGTYSTQQTVQLFGNVAPFTGSRELTFGTPPSPAIWVGATAGENITVNDPIPGDNSIIALGISGPGGYSASFSAIPVKGFATFSLSSTPFNTAGSYQFTAGGGSFTPATASETVQAVTLGETIPSATVPVPILQLGSIASVLVLTEGAPNLDFTAASGGTCIPGSVIEVGDSCIVNVKLAPSGAGLRTGAVLVLDGSGKVLGTTPLAAIVQGPEIAWSPNTTSALPGGWNHPAAVATDGAGNLYVMENQGSLVKVPFTGSGWGSPVQLAGSVAGGVAVDRAGNVFYTDLLHGAVYKLPWNGSSYGTRISIPTGVATAWAGPEAIAVDAQDNLYVADQTCQCVYMVPWTGSGYGPGTYLNYPWNLLTGIGVDPSGNVYVADNQDNVVIQFPKTSTGFGSANPISTGAQLVWGVATDDLGNLYVSDVGTGAVSLLIAQPGGGFGGANPLNSSFYGPQGMAIAPNGNVFVADPSANQLSEINLASPPALNFPTPTQLGTTDTADGPQSDYLTNIGNETLVFSTPPSGTNPSYPANFPVNAAASGLCGGSVGAGSSCAISANFVPLQAGANSGQIILTDSAFPNPQKVSLNGNTTAGTTITSPVPRSTLPGLAATFTWKPAKGATSFRLEVGTKGAGSSNVFSSGAFGATSIKVTNLPEDGQTLYVRLYSTAKNITVFTDYTYREAVWQAVPAITGPAPGSTLTGSRATFSWKAGGGTGRYMLKVGTTGAGSSNIYSTSAIAATSATVSGIPTRGAHLYVRLYYLADGRWQTVDYVYKEAGPSGGQPQPLRPLVHASRFDDLK